MAVGRHTLEAFVEDLVTIELAPNDAALPRAAAYWVAERAVRASALARYGLLVPAVILDLATSTRYVSRYSKLQRAQRLRIAGGLVRTRMPLVEDWVRAIRLLAIMYVFERRFG